MSSPITATYSTVDGIDIQLDVYLPVGAQGALPALVYFHGGGLVTGGRKDILFPFWKDDVLARNIAFISADYRLLLPYSSHDQIADVRAVFTFLASPANLTSHLPTGVTIDATRLAVSGASAGGYIASLAAIYANPRPKAVFGLYGMGGDYLLDHYLQSHSTNIRFFGPFPPKEKVAPVIDAPTRTASAPLILGKSGVVDPSGRLDLYSWFFHTGELVDYITGIPGLSQRLRVLPYNERAGALPEEARAVFPQLFRGPDHPPTILLHGGGDSAVLVSESEHAFEQLKSAGVETELIVVPGAEHGILDFPSRTPAEGSAEAHAKGIDFIAAKLV